MSLREFFSLKAERDTAKKMVAQIQSSLPIEMIGDKRKILSVNKLTKLLEQSYQIAADHQKNKRIGLVRRSILANHFKWMLKDANYPDDFIDVATEGLVMALAKRPNDNQSRQ